MLFKRDLYVEKKRHNKSFKRHIMLFYFPFCFLGLVFCPSFRRKETKNHYENMPISNIQKILPPKTENFQIKTTIFFMFLLKT